MFSMVMATLFALTSSVDAAGLPVDARLDPVRGKLEQLIERAEVAGLPSEMIISKVREGLAKGVDPTRIEAAAARLTDNLQAAQQFVVARRPGRPTTSLVRAVAEARAAGVAMVAIERVVKTPQPEQQRAVEVITDLSLPGMNGFELVAAVRSDPALRGTPIICLSGYGGLAHEQRAQEAGCDRILQKPCMPDALADLAAELIREAAERGSK